MDMYEENNELCQNLSDKIVSNEQTVYECMICGENFHDFEELEHHQENHVEVELNTHQREDTGSKNSFSTTNDQDGFNHENFNYEEFNCEIYASQKHIYTGILINGNATKVGENNAVFENAIDNPSMVQVVSFQHSSSGMPADQLEDIAQDYSTHQPRHRMHYQLINEHITNGTLSKPFEHKTKYSGFPSIGRNKSQAHHQSMSEHIRNGAPANQCDDITTDDAFYMTQQMHHQGIPEGAGVPDSYCEDVTKDHTFHNTDKRQKHHQPIFECAICQLKFHMKDELREHKIATHYNQMPFECSSCGKRFKLGNEVQEHSLICNGRNKQKRLPVIHELPHGVPFVSAIMPGHALDAGKQSVFIKCQFCGATFDQVFNLQQHMSVHELEKTFKCDVCGRSFESRSTLSVHSFVHSGKEKYYCDTCYKVFRVRGTFLRHKSRCNRNEDDNYETGFDDAMLEQACVTLGIVNRKEKLDSSDNSEPKSDLEHGQCDTLEGNNLSSDSLITNGEDQVNQIQPCQENGADNTDQNVNTSDSSNLLKSSICQTRNKAKEMSKGRHKSVGKNEMAFECTLCGLKFEEQNSLLEHSSSHNQDPKQNSLKSSETSPMDSQAILIRCNLCGEIFNDHAKLDQHMSSHGVSLSYPCIQCSKVFSSKGLLMNHSRVHSDIRSFMCDLCQRTFKYKGSLKKHKKHCVKDPCEQESFDRWFAEKLQATGKYMIGEF